VRGELSAIQGALPRLRKKVPFPDDEQLFASVDALIAGCGGSEGRNVRRRTD
jgi:hypothetical protein